MSANDILTLAIGSLGAAIALGTLVKACLEYVRQGRTERMQMFFDLRRRLKEPELGRVAELIDEAQSPDPHVAEPAERELAKLSLRIKRDYLGLFEEVGLAMNRGLIEPGIAHYMFGYYALHCAGCDAFWIGVGQLNPYWDRFYEFCKQMEVERKRFEQRRDEVDQSALRASLGRTMPPATADGVAATQLPAPALSVRIPPVLRPRTGGTSVVDVNGHSVIQALEDLVDSFPDLRWHVFCGEKELAGEPRALNRYLNVYYDDQDVHVLEGLETPVVAGGTIVLLPATSGG